jgi:hypothetical protein
MRYPIALVIALFVSASGAIEPPKQDKPPPSTATPPSAPEQEPVPETTPPAGAQPAEAPAAEEEEEETLPPLPADTAPGPSPTRFTPTEKVRADFPVSFPIDI